LPGWTRWCHSGSAASAAPDRRWPAAPSGGESDWPASQWERSRRPPWRRRSPHGAADTHTPPAQSKELYAAAHEPKQLWIVPGAEHVGCYDTARQEYERRVTQFFRDALL
jgi:hypothetical protein